MQAVHNSPVHSSLDGALGILTEADGSRQMCKYERNQTKDWTCRINALVPPLLALRLFILPSHPLTVSTQTLISSVLMGIVVIPMFPRGIVQSLLVPPPW
jgi:hypothetical protein